MGVACPLEGAFNLTQMGPCAWCREVQRGELVRERLARRKGLY